MLSSLVVQPGFEPRLTEPKSGVLPLHHWTIFQAFLMLKNGCKSTKIFSNTQIFLQTASQYHHIIITLRPSPLTNNSF